MAPQSTNQKLPGGPPPSVFSETPAPSPDTPERHKESADPQEGDPRGVAKRKSDLSKEAKAASSSEPPPSAFAEASEPSQEPPGEHDQSQIARPQEENPQAVVKRKSKL